MIKFGANILSQTVQRNLGRATLDLSTTSERLSSGQRINKASDDAAGLAIAASLNVNSRVFTQGVRNLNDGLSAVNIAEGAIEELGNIIVRIEELAAQSISETYSNPQRESLQKEATALVSEWNRIVESTSFNGRDLLTGASTRTVLQGGKGSEGTLAVQIGEAQLAGGLEGYGGRGTTRISTSSTGIEGNGVSGSYAAISPDGRFVAFTSTASNLVAGDTNGMTDVFLKDTTTGTLTRVNSDSAGNEANGESIMFRGFTVTSGGRYVVFNSSASNLVAGDTNGCGDIFVKDTLTGVTTRASTNSAGIEANGLSGFLSRTRMSDDGRYVAFVSTATNLASNSTTGQGNVFYKDLVTGATTVVNTSSSGEVANAYSQLQGISADGRYVFFETTASNLVAGDTNGLRDLFRKDTQTGTTTRVSTNSSGGQSNSGAMQYSVMSADGRYVAFASSDSTDLIADDTNGLTDVFLKDIETGELTIASRNSSGEAAVGGFSRMTGLSADGRYLAFYSGATNLVEGDTNGLFDQFIKDTKTGTTIRVGLDSSGNQPSSGTTGMGVLSADGRTIAFYSTASNLVSGDGNGVGDIFLRDLTKTGVQTLSGVVVSNKVGAKITLDLVQKYRAELLDYRSKLGATTSRISTFVNTLQSATINYKAASSRISDADIADEAAKSVANNIRQQVASSLLGQANQAPQIGLQLLRNA